jgi:hypothetical protein
LDQRYQAYWDAIRKRVCAVCLDATDDGGCALSGDRVCSLEAHLPAVVEALIKVQSDRMDDYVAAIEAQVCGRCGELDEQGRCRVRDRGECGLATYLSLVVDAVEAVKAAEGGLRQ